MFVIIDAELLDGGYQTMASGQMSQVPAVGDHVSLDGTAPYVVVYRRWIVRRNDMSALIRVRRP